MSSRSVFFLLMFAWPVFLEAQEIKYIDISNVRPRTELRHPPAPPSDCKDGTHCLGSGYGGGSVGDGAPDNRDPHALGIYLLNVLPTTINPAEPFQVEFKALNTGSAPIELPVSPHLSDLQPNDESQPFSYFSLALVVRGEGDAVGFVELYGSLDQPESMLILQPSQWIRVRAHVALRSSPSEQGPMELHGEFWLRKNTFHPHAGGQFVESRNLYPNTTRTPSLTVRVLPLRASEKPKQ